MGDSRLPILLAMENLATVHAYQERHADVAARLREALGTFLVNPTLNPAATVRVELFLAGVVLRLDQGGEARRPATSALQRAQSTLGSRRTR